MSGEGPAHTSCRRLIDSATCNQRRCKRLRCTSSPEPYSVLSAKWVRFGRSLVLPADLRRRNNAPGSIFMRRMGLKSACLAAKGSQSQREINRSIGFSFFRMVVLEDEEKENKRKLRYRKGQKLDPMPYCSLISNISYIQRVESIHLFR